MGVSAASGWGFVSLFPILVTKGLSIVVPAKNCQVGDTTGVPKPQV